MPRRPYLVAGGVLALALLCHVEAEVLQEDDRAGSGVCTGRLHSRTHAVIQEGHVPGGDINMY